jgi:hypothetical protein
MEFENCLTPKDLQEILKLKKSATYRLLATGVIPSLIITNSGRRRCFRVRPQDLEKWLKSREVRRGRS